VTAPKGKRSDRPNSEQSERPKRKRSDRPKSEHSERPNSKQSERQFIYQLTYNSPRINLYLRVKLDSSEQPSDWTLIFFGCEYHSYHLS